MNNIINLRLILFKNNIIIYYYKMADDTASVLNMNTSILSQRDNDTESVATVEPRRRRNNNENTMSELDAVDHTESESEQSYNMDGGKSKDSDVESEYEEYDLTENPLYQVLAAFLEDDEGNNLCDHIQQLTDAVKENTKRLDSILTSKSSDKSSSQLKKVKKSK